MVMFDSMCHTKHDANVHLLTSGWIPGPFIFLSWKANHCFTINDYQRLFLVPEGLQHSGQESE